jgi:hypothetical protein
VSTIVLEIRLDRQRLSIDEVTNCNAPHCKRIYELKYPTVSESN